MPKPATLQQLMEAAVHFGHKTQRWNPKMRSFLLKDKDTRQPVVRNGIYILDLSQTIKRLNEASRFVSNLTANHESILFVGTKKQAQSTIQEEAERSGQFYVNQRWLGGMLTNFKTIQARIKYMKELEQRKANGEFERLPKKEAQQLEDELERLSRTLGGIRSMTRLPGAVFVVDTKKEHTAVLEARRLEIPVIALADTNTDPDEMDIPIPANDDAIRSVRFLCARIADAAIEGRAQAEARRKDAVSAEEDAVEMTDAPVTAEDFGGEPEATPDATPEATPEPVAVASDEGEQA
ncbi:MAG TPA: 30S ribosomal protein S2 [Ktedonobacterales bacterium]